MRQIKRIVVAGTGGLGYWLLWCLCRDLSGTGVTLEAYDPDNFVGGSGHRRLPLVSRPEMKKVDLLAMQIRNIMGDMLHRAYSSPLTPEDFKIGDWNETLVVDSTDAPIDKRRLWWDAAKAAGARVIRASYEGRTEMAGGIAVVSTSLPFQKNGSTEGGYHSTPSQSLSFMAAGLAGEMIQEMLKAGKIEDKQVEIPVTAISPEPLVETPINYCETVTCVNEVEGGNSYCNDCLAADIEEPF